MHSRQVNLSFCTFRGQRVIPDGADHEERAHHGKPGAHTDTSSACMSETWSRKGRRRQTAAAAGIHAAGESFSIVHVESRTPRSVCAGGPTACRAHACVRRLLLGSIMRSNTCQKKSHHHGVVNDCGSQPVANERAARVEQRPQQRGQQRGARGQDVHKGGLEHLVAIEAGHADNYKCKRLPWQCPRQEGSHPLTCSPTGTKSLLLQAACAPDRMHGSGHHHEQQAALKPQRTAGLRLLSSACLCQKCCISSLSWRICLPGSCFFLCVAHTALSRSLKMRQKMMKRITGMPTAKAVRHSPLSLRSSYKQLELLCEAAVSGIRQLGLGQA